MTFCQRRHPFLGRMQWMPAFYRLGLNYSRTRYTPKNESQRLGKFECQFTAVTVEESSSVMLQGMEGSTLGIWAAHGEGKFNLPLKESEYHISAKYHHDQYPSNPNGSDYNAAMLCSKNGRHLVMITTYRTIYISVELGPLSREQNRPLFSLDYSIRKCKTMDRQL